MEVTVLGLPSCDACRAARRALAAAGMRVTFRDVRAEPLSAGEIAALLDRFGTALLNRKSATWRGLAEAERQGDPAALLAAHPALMKRPVLLAGAEARLGWSAEVRRAIGL